MDAFRDIRSRLSCRVGGPSFIYKGLPGAMPRQVTVTQSGGSFSVLGGVPTTGEISADGHFTARNSLGTCRGQVTGRISKETCTNALRQSCHAT